MLFCFICKNGRSVRFRYDGDVSMQTICRTTPLWMSKEMCMPVQTDLILHLRDELVPEIDDNASFFSLLKVTKCSSSVKLCLTPDLTVFFLSIRSNSAEPEVRTLSYVMYCVHLKFSFTKHFCIVPRLGRRPEHIT